MSTTTISYGFSNSSGEIDVFDSYRNREIVARHQTLVELARVKGLDGLLLFDPANFGWLTCGGDCTHKGNFPSVAAILVTADARVILTNNVDSAQLFDQELNGMGFLVKERPWPEDPHVLITDVCRGRKIGTDSCLPGTHGVGEELAALRAGRSDREADRMRELATALTHAVEAAARTFEPGAEEAEVAGQIAHRLMKHLIEPVRIQVLADGRFRRYRHGAYARERIERHCVLTAIGRKHGLHVGVTRTVCLGAPSAEMLDDYQLAAFVLATGMRFSHRGQPVAEIWKRIGRIYEKFGAPDEWRLSDQAEFIGYQPCEARLVPGSTLSLPDQAAIYWHPSVRAASVGETVLIRDGRCELLTRSANWPMLAVRSGADLIDVPGILIREVHPGFL